MDGPVEGAMELFHVSHKTWLMANLIKKNVFKKIN